jgi:hypothetical protein
MHIDTVRHRRFPGAWRALVTNEQLPQSYRIAWPLCRAAKQQRDEFVAAGLTLPLVRSSYGLIPVPPHLRHLTILSPFLRVPFPSQFLHVCFLSPTFFHTNSSRVGHRSSPLGFKGCTQNPTITLMTGA